MYSRPLAADIGSARLAACDKVASGKQGVAIVASDSDRAYLQDRLLTAEEEARLAARRPALPWALPLVLGGGEGGGSLSSCVSP